MKTLDQYINDLRFYTDEQKQAVREFREGAEHVPYEQYRYLIEQKLFFRTRKLTKPRNIYFKDEKFWYLNHVLKRYEYIGWLHSEEFLAERKAKEEQERLEIEERRKAKKEAKALEAKKKERARLKELGIKKPRKRIQK